MDEKLIESIVREVAKNINIAKNQDTFGIFDNMKEAIEYAYSSQKKFLSSNLECRRKIVDSIRNKLRPLIKEMSSMAVEETKMDALKIK